MSNPIVSSEANSENLKFFLELDEKALLDGVIDTNEISQTVSKLSLCQRSDPLPYWINSNVTTPISDTLYAQNNEVWNSTPSTPSYSNLSAPADLCVLSDHEKINSSICSAVLEVHNGDEEKTKKERKRGRKPFSDPSSAGKQCGDKQEVKFGRHVVRKGSEEYQRRRNANREAVKRFRSKEKKFIDFQTNVPYDLVRQNRELKERIKILELELDFYKKIKPNSI